MDVKGQGALEYLLLIGGAVLVAAIVIALITGIPTGVIPPEVATYCATKGTFDACGTITCAAPFVAKDGSGWACAPETVTGLPATGSTDFGKCGTAQTAC